jgi:hypothetical protein
LEASILQKHFIHSKKKILTIFLKIMLEIALCHYETDEAIKEKKFKELKADIAPMYLDKLDEIAKANNGYLANGKVKLKQN